eukprot:scaffold19628_cov28-Tisochrysis_lutea.AAC.4
MAREGQSVRGDSSTHHHSGWPIQYPTWILAGSSPGLAHFYLQSGPPGIVSGRARSASRRARVPLLPETHNRALAHAALTLGADIVSQWRTREISTSSHSCALDRPAPFVADVMSTRRNPGSRESMWDGVSPPSALGPRGHSEKGKEPIRLGCRRLDHLGLINHQAPPHKREEGRAESPCVITTTAPIGGTPTLGSVECLRTWRGSVGVIELAAQRLEGGEDEVAFGEGGGMTRC